MPVSERLSDDAPCRCVYPDKCFCEKGDDVPDSERSSVNRTPDVLDRTYADEGAALIADLRAEVERLREALRSDESAEMVSRRLNPQAWEVVESMKPATRDEYAEALRSEARRALAALNAS